MSAHCVQREICKEGSVSWTGIKKKWWQDPESNWGHEDFQSSALPTELSRHHLVSECFNIREPILEGFNENIQARKSKNVFFLIKR